MVLGIFCSLAWLNKHPNLDWKERIGFLSWIRGHKAVSVVRRRVALKVTDLLSLLVLLPDIQDPSDETPYLLRRRNV